MTLYLVLLALGVILLSFVGIVALAIMRLYYEVDRSRSEDERRDHLMPRHVWQVTLSYSILGVAAVVPMERTLRAALAFVALALGINALRLVYEFHQGRHGRGGVVG